MPAKYSMSPCHLWDLHSLVFGPAFGTFKIRFQRLDHQVDYYRIRAVSHCSKSVLDSSSIGARIPAAG
jgi:hypothetical protein